MVSGAWYLSDQLVAYNGSKVHINNSTDLVTLIVLKYSDVMQCCDVEDLKHPYEYVYGVSDETHSSGM